MYHYCMRCCPAHAQGPSALHHMFNPLYSFGMYLSADAAARLFAGLVRRGHRADAIDKVRSLHAL